MLTDREGVHPSAAVGGELHGHPGRGEGVDERPLGSVASWTDVQRRLSTAHGEPARGAAVPLRVQHLLQQICTKNKDTSIRKLYCQFMWKFARKCSRDIS